MNREILGLAIAAMLLNAVPVSAQPKASQKTVRLATLNCEFLNRGKVHIKFGESFTLTGAAKTKWNKAGFRDARLREASQAVAKVLHRINADVVGLTEVGPKEDVEILQDELKKLGLTYDHLAVCDSSDGTTGQHVAVLSKHPFEKIERTIAGREGYYQELDDPESEKDTGVSKGMQVMFQARGRRVNLFVAHLASERGGHEQDAQRIAQASIVRRTYLKALNNDEHVILMGDLNDHRGQPTLRRIRGLDDIFPDLIQPGGPLINRQRSKETNAEYNARIGSHWTFEFSGQKNQIDHILYSHSIKDECKRGGISISFEPVTEKIGSTDHLATDHRGVVLDLKLR